MQLRLGMCLRIHTVCVWEQETHTRTHARSCMQRERAAIRWKPSETFEGKSPRHDESLLSPGRAKDEERQSEISEIVSRLNDTGPTWERGEGKIWRRYDEARDRSPPANTHTHTHWIIKNCLRNELHSSQTEFSVYFSLLVFLLTVTAFFLGLCHFTICCKNPPVGTPTVSPRTMCRVDFDKLHRPNIWQ